MHGLQRGANHDWEATLCNCICPPSFFLTKSASAIQLASQVDAMVAVKVSRTMLNQFGPELA